MRISKTNKHDCCVLCGRHRGGYSAIGEFCRECRTRMHSVQRCPCGRIIRKSKRNMSGYCGGCNWKCKR